MTVIEVGATDSSAFMPAKSARAPSRRTILLGGLVTLPGLVSAGCATDPDDAALEASAEGALQQLLAQNEGARSLARDARAILTFPEIRRGGLMVGAHDGKGVLRVGDEVAGYYLTGGVSFGLQAGVQKYALASFSWTIGRATIYDVPAVGRSAQGRP